MPEIQHGMVVDGHLGGYIPGGDPATVYEALWQALIDDGVESIIDVGCGDGVALRYFAARGVTVVGVDGIEQPDDRILQHDYTTGPLALPEADLAWSCEFVEHVEERYIANFARTFQCARTLLMTHAMPGQGGWHHVNCQPSTYWIDRLSEYGFEYDERLTKWSRDLAGLNPHPANHYARSGLAFQNLGAT